MSEKNVTYTGRRVHPDQKTVSEVVVLRTAINSSTEVADLKHVNLHSPTGYNWGYLGSGPADLALSLLADALGETFTKRELRQGYKDCACTYGDPNCKDCGGTGGIPIRSWHLHQPFKEAFVARWTDHWTISRNEIVSWVQAYEAEEAKRHAQQ